MPERTSSRITLRRTGKGGVTIRATGAAAQALADELDQIGKLHFMRRSRPGAGR